MGFPFMGKLYDRIYVSSYYTSLQILEQKCPIYYNVVKCSFKVAATIEKCLNCDANAVI